MTDKNERCYTFQNILNFFGFDIEFNKKDKQYPFNRGKDNIYFSWGQIIIPKLGIFETVQNKISDINTDPIFEINMIYNIPFYEDNKEKNIKTYSGIININISLTFRYDKQYEYGDINRSIYEVCFWILEHAKRTNDFYIITDNNIQHFMSYYVFNNQWTLGSLNISSTCVERML